jgi:hypothetical protein
VTGDEKKASPAGSSAKEDGAGDERSERSTPGTVMPAPDGDRTSGSSTAAATESDPPQAEIRTKIRALLTDPSLPDPASPPDLTSRRSYVSAFMDMLRKAQKKNKRDERDGRYAGAPDKKKQTDKEKQKTLKKPPDPPERKEPRKVRSIREATNQNSRPVAKDAPAPKKDRERSLDATWPKGRKLSEGGSR